MEIIFLPSNSKMSEETCWEERLLSQLSSKCDFHFRFPGRELAELA